MSGNDQTNQRQPPQIYTIYPGTAEANVNYGFTASHAQAPPPKYEDVMNGTHQQPTQQPIYIPQENLESANVILIAPKHKPSGLERSLGLIFLFIFLISFISILVKIMGRF